MDELCLICNEIFSEDSHFWKKHKIKIADYYSKYLPKYDLYTKEPITFKSREQYLLNDCLNRRNLANYIENIENIEEKRDFCLKLLEKRRDIKNLIYSPTQVELKSVILPTMLTYEKIFSQGYYKLCEEIGLKNKFTKVLKEPISLTNKYNEKYHIIIDTREQTPFKFNFPIQVGKLDVGDYGFSHAGLSKDVFVERKNITDFISTLSSGYDRFKRELDRAKANNAYLVIVVESRFNYVISFDYSKWLSKFTRATPDFIFHRVRELCQMYKNIQFVFLDGPSNAAKFTQFILTSDGISREIDLQYHLDINKIIF